MLRIDLPFTVFRSLFRRGCETRVDTREQALVDQTLRSCDHPHHHQQQQQHQHQPSFDTILLR